MTANVPTIKAGGDSYGGAYVRVTPVITVDEAGNYVAPGAGGGSGGIGTPTGSAGSPNAAVVTVQGIAGGTPQAVADAIADAALGTPTDTPWTSGAATLVGLGKRMVGLLAGTLTTTINGALPAGTNTIGTVAVSNPTAAFTPIPVQTTTLTVGPTVTSTPVALPATTAAVYRVRNPQASASPVTWRLSTDSTARAAIGTPWTTAGANGTPGDKSIDPGNVEVLSLTAAQQTALAAGSLYLTALTPAGGSATLSITPGVSGL